MSTRSSKAAGRLTGILCTLALLAPAAPAAAAPSYYPSGPQANVPRTALTGWTQCWRGTYEDSGDSIAGVLAGCPGDYLLLASGPVGASTFDVLAAAPRADVLFDTGTTNTPHVANGSGWYFNAHHSWGFAKQGDPITRNSCDTQDTSWDGFVGVNGHLRMCWHTFSGTIGYGWRSGTNAGLNWSSSFERFIFVAGGNEAPAVGSIAGDTSVEEGDTETYAVTASDPDSDPLTYAWSITSGGGEIVGASDGSSVEVSFPDGPDSSGLQVEVSDGQGHTETRSTTVDVANVAPATSALALTGGAATACIGGNTVGLDFTFNDPALAHDTYDGSIDWGDSATGSFTGSPVSASHTFAAGDHVIRVNVSDSDGAAAEERTAAVSLRYARAGFQAPIDDDGTSTFRIGSTVPVKMTVTDCDGVPVGTLSPDVDLRKVDAAPATDVNEVVSTSSADSGDRMRYDPTGSRYVYNLSTKNSEFCSSDDDACSDGSLTPGTYELTVSHATFAPLTARFDLRN